MFLKGRRLVRTLCKLSSESVPEAWQSIKGRYHWMFDVWMNLTRVSIWYILHLDIYLRLILFEIFLQKFNVFPCITNSKVLDIFHCYNHIIEDIPFCIKKEIHDSFPILDCLFLLWSWLLLLLFIKHHMSSGVILDVVRSIEVHQFFIQLRLWD